MPAQPLTSGLDSYCTRASEPRKGPGYEVELL
jgi:hypothetical protein